MGISIYNQERYADSTPCFAIANIERRKKKEREALTKHHSMVFICSPYSGDIKNNIKDARRFCRFAVVKGKVPFAPHLLFTQFLNDKSPFERELGIVLGCEVMRKCTEIWVFGSISPGMKEEIDFATENRIRIKYFNKDLEEVKENA